MDYTDSTHIKGAKHRPSTFIFREKEELLDSFPFDPNTADSTALLRLGLTPWQVRSVYRFRAKHGRYHKAEDFKRTPNLTVEQWEHLQPLIRINPRFQLLADVDNHGKKQQESSPHSPIEQKRSTIKDADRKSTRERELAQAPSAEKIVQDSTLHRPKKLTAGKTVNLNTADSTELLQVPNIGPYRAGKIVRYRRALGGFVHPLQVMEACQMPDEVIEWFSLEPTDVRRININNASVQQMMRHPYISFYMARDIAEWRKKHGAISDESAFFALPFVRENEVPYLRHYITF